MRSAGYFFQTRAQLADLLGGHAMFLPDEETIEYLYLSLGIDNSKQNTDNQMMTMITALIQKVLPM